MLSSVEYIFYFNMMLLSLLMFSAGFLHVLKVLLCLEFIIINVLMMMMSMFNYDYTLYLCLYYLVFSVSDSILGLSLMVIMVRHCGNDYVKSLLVNS